jgi:hypothetical protein
VFQVLSKHVILGGNIEKRVADFFVAGTRSSQANPTRLFAVMPGL